jgi:pimeloyl-ACP methyl ester carboxylesterase
VADGNLSQSRSRLQFATVIQLLLLPVVLASTNLQEQTPIEWVRPPIELPRGLADSVRFGFLTVPQDYAQPQGAQFRLAVAVFAARAARKLPDPVVFVMGGPGLPGIEPQLRARVSGAHPFDVYREHRDLVVIDSRGHGYSEPHMCAELRGADPIIDNANAERTWLSKLAACRATLRTRGVRIETLSAANAARDLESLRLALGVPQLNVFGASYGSRIAGEAMRLVPSRVRAVYMFGPVPPTRFRVGNEPVVADEALTALFRDCARQPGCRRAYPNLRGDYDSALAIVQRSPLRVEVARTEDMPGGVVVVDAQLLRRMLAQSLVSRDAAAVAPLLIHTIASGATDALARITPYLVESFRAGRGTAGTGLAFWCNDGVVGPGSSMQLQQRCRTWLGGAWQPITATDLRSDIPALLTVGKLDPLTPPSFTQFLAAGMQRAQIIELPSWGHEQPPACALRISNDFFNATQRQIETSPCLDSVAPVDYVTGIKYSARVGRTFKIFRERVWFLVWPAAAALLLVWPLLRRLRWARKDALLVATSLVGLLFVIGTTAVLAFTSRHHALIPMIGIPFRWAWLLWLPHLFLALTIALFIADRPPSRSTIIGALMILGLWY